MIRLYLLDWPKIVIFTSDNLPLYMKDQRKLLHKCMHAEIPVFVLCGSDSCAIEALEAYYGIAKRKGCSQEFLDDLELLINDFRTFRKEEPEKVRLPD